MFFKRIQLLYHTLRFLTLRQIVYRLIYTVANKAKLIPWNNNHNLSTHNSRLNNILPRTPWLESETIDADDVNKGVFRFLNRSEAFDHRVQWTAPGRDRLWQYNLHYFDFLFPLRGINPYRASLLINDWVTHNPEGTPDAWDPFPTSLRVVNWLKYWSIHPSRITEGAVTSLREQCRRLERSIEYHLMGNHLFKNGKALIFAGICLKGGDAQRWLQKGKEIIENEIHEQVLADGGHFERSPMYHTMVFEDVLDMLNILPEGDPWFKFRSVLRNAADRMALFLDYMKHPDGKIALFNDAALNIESSPQRLIDYYEQISGTSFITDGQRCAEFRDSGYYIITPDKNSRMIVDCGAVGPDYQPGHAHCDTLSFELSLFGHRVIVDSGCCSYSDMDIRKYNRSNLGHNSLTIDGYDQSEVWSSHRCGRRAYPIAPKLTECEGGTFIFSGAHDGYKRLKGRPIHHRRIEWGGRRILITDRVEGKGRHDIALRLHVHPNLTVSKEKKSLAIHRKGRLVMSVNAHGAGEVDIEQGWYCPEFGIRVACPVLSIEFKDARLPLKTGWVFTIRYPKEALC